VVLFADVDFMTDLQAVEKLSSSLQQAFRPINDNLSLIQKAVEFVGGNRDLIRIRSSSRRPRPLFRFQQMKEQSQTKAEVELERINTQLVSLQERLSLILSSSAQTEDRMPSVQRDDLRNMRLEEAKLRNERRNYQRTLAAEIFWFQATVVLLAALASPCLLGILRFLSWRRGKAKQSLNSNKSGSWAQSPEG
jgi:hypothetical protein